jgi:hypothetical protein
VGTTTCWQTTATDSATNVASSVDRCVGVPIDDRDAALTVEGPTQQVADGSAWQGTITRLGGQGAQVTLSFTGRKVGILMQKRPNGGKARIFLDGAVVQTVDTYAASVGQKKFLWRSVLSAGPHTVRVAWTGSKNRNSSDYDIAIDGIAIIATP